MDDLTRLLLERDDRRSGQVVYGVASDDNTVAVRGAATAVELPALIPVKSGDYCAVWESGADRLILGPVGRFKQGTDITTALQAALDECAALSPVGGVVELPHGSFEISDTIVVPARVTLRGAGNKATQLATNGSFPTNTPLVQLGETPGATQAQGCRLEDLELYSTTAGSVGVYSEVINEKSGCRDVLVRCVKGGYHIDDTGSGSPKNYTIEHCQAIISGNVGDEFGYIIRTPTGATVKHCTANASNTMDYCFGLDGEGINLIGCHAENGINGVQVGIDGVTQGTVIVGLTGPNDGANDMDDLIHLTGSTTGAGDYARGVTIIGAVKNEAQNSTINYDEASLTFDDAVVSLWALGTGGSGGRSLYSSTWDWSSFTPSWTNLTVGNGSQSAEYRRVLGGLLVRGSITLGSTSAITGAPRFTIPDSVTTSASTGDRFGGATFIESGGSTYPGDSVQINTTSIGFRCFDASGTYTTKASLSSSVPFTWGAGDEIRWDAFVPINDV